MTNSCSNFIALALGANLDHPEETFRRAIALLKAGGVRGILRASLYRTKPVDCHPGTPDFTNSALTGFWDGSAESLLDLTQGIEIRLGRPAVHDSHGSRTIDLDLLLFGNQIINTPRLTVPHPRMTERLFVLNPLAEIAGDRTVPGTGKIVRELRQELLSRQSLQPAIINRKEYHDHTGTA